MLVNHGHSSKNRNIRNEIRNIIGKTKWNDSRNKENRQNVTQATIANKRAKTTKLVKSITNRILEARLELIQNHRKYKKTTAEMEIKSRGLPNWRKDFEKQICMDGLD